MLEEADTGNFVEETAGDGTQGGRWSLRARACAWGHAAQLSRGSRCAAALFRV